MFHLILSSGFTAPLRRSATAVKSPVDIFDKAASWGTYRGCRSLNVASNAQRINRARSIIMRSGLAYFKLGCASTIAYFYRLDNQCPLMQFAKLRRRRRRRRRHCDKIMHLHVADVLRDASS